MIDTAKLKEKILDLAIRGKLVPQDPNDEPASVLLERIRAEKLQMVKDGKLKQKDIKDDTIIFLGDDNLHYEKFADGSVKCIEDEIPFEIPKSWAWARLGSYAQKITDYVASGSFASIKENVSVLKNKDYAIMVKTADFSNNFTQNLTYTTEHGYNYLENSNLFGGELILSNIGSIGKVFIVPKLNQKMTLAPNTIMIKLVNDEYRDYVYNFLLSPFGYSQLLKISGGTGIAKFNKTDLKTLLLPVPPFNEQTRTIDNLKNYFSLIKFINTNKEGLLQSVDSLKSKILDLAIRGKLVPQDPNDEPADVLLERIRKEKEKLIKQGKIKREKKESIIFKGDDNSYYEKFNNGECQNISDKIPFIIPNNWMWVRLGSLFQHNTGKTLNSSDKNGELYEYITTSNVYWDRIDLNNVKKMFFQANEIEKYTVRKNDLLVCEGGDIGRSAIWNKDYEIRFQNHIHRLRPFINLPVKFYYYVFYLLKSSGLVGGNGIGIQSLPSNKLDEIILPLPPYNEQNKIIDQIEKNIVYIDQIKKSLN